MQTAAARHPYQMLATPGHESHLLGDGHFPQGDPRAWTKDPDGWMLLLELPSDERFGLCWGDGQEPCIFIRADALAALHFSELWLYLNP